MGLQEMEKLQLHRHHGGNMRVEAATAAGDDDQSAGGGRRNNTAAAAVWIALPLIRPVKVGCRRHGDSEEDKEEVEVTTPRGEEWRIPAEAATCPPAPKKARTAAVAIVSDRRCNRDDGEVTEYYRVPADLDSVFAVVGRLGEAN